MSGRLPLRRPKSSAAVGSRRPSERRPTTTAKRSDFAFYANGQTASATTAGNRRQRILQKTWIRNLPSLVALGCLLVVLIYCLGLSTSPRVVIANHDGVSLRDSQTYQAGAAKILRGSLANHSKLTIDTADFERTFQKEFPEVSSVSLGLPLVGRRPVVSITTAQPELLLAANNQLYVIDKRGSAIMVASDLPVSTRQKLPLIHDQSGLAIKLGQVVLSSENINFIMVVDDQLTAQKLTVSDITLPTVPHQVNFRLTGQPYYIKFSFDTDARQSAGSLLAVRQYLAGHNTAPAEYIDLRVPGRAYYR